MGAEDGWERRMARRSLSVEVYAQALVQAHAAVETAVERLETLSRHGKGPVGDPGCCYQWEWKQDVLSPHWHWARTATCRVYEGERGCDHQHHDDDGTWVAIG